MDKKQYVTIGKLASISGVPTDTIRYYEKLGVLGKPERASNGYRVYAEDTIRVLRFIRRAKRMNFTLEEIKLLLTMNDNNDAVCGEILEMVTEKMSAFKRQIEDTQIALSELEQFAHDCPGGKVPTQHCPFIQYLNVDQNQDKKSQGE